jgi:hypothetical protein
VVVVLFVGIGIGAATPPEDADRDTETAAADETTTTAEDAESTSTSTTTERSTTTIEPSTTTTPTTQPPEPPPGPATTFGDGTFVVNQDIAPGTYRTEGGEYCYWERLNGFNGSFDEIIANDLPTGPSIVTIEPTDAGFTSDGCGTWAAAG